ncbi:hypothetical protein Pmani_033624 [Petrolisthes manimaculis]|uniref:Kazal-like domain-containing protein n=1 Tax=Petrolisthes manimaculis TaxID=1843537 RepID=A0AAE1NQN3_9EUCA|nr:hypothetical protein Pmani_033624 [Petrolisthes manimaculis]
MVQRGPMMVLKMIVVMEMMMMETTTTTAYSKPSTVLQFTRFPTESPLNYCDINPADPVPSDSSCGKPCSSDYHPVCGTDNVTYKNSCQLTQANCKTHSITVAFRGECFGEDDKCPPNVCSGHVDPVCGSDDRTYINECWLQHAKCFVRDLAVKWRKTTCEVQKRYCNNKCDYPGSPICISDGATHKFFKDACDFAKAKCLNPEVTSVSLDMCKGLPFYKV